MILPRAALAAEMLEQGEVSEPGPRWGQRMEEPRRKEVTEKHNPEPVPPPHRGVLKEFERIYKNVQRSSSQERIKRQQTSQKMVRQKKRAKYAGGTPGPYSEVGV